MFDRKSDYALNKQDPEAIVCRNVNDGPIRLTREDFASDEEFLKWKKWSDQDYRATYNTGRGYYDNCVQLDETTDTPCQSAEDVLLSLLQKTERDKNRTAVLKQLQHKLTDKQYRRLLMYYLQGMSEADIAAKEGVSQQQISRSIISGKKIVERFFSRIFRQ